MKYRIYAIISASKYIGEVEADSKEEAEELAWNHENMGVLVCHQCAKEVEDPEVRDLEIIEKEE